MISWSCISNYSYYRYHYINPPTPILSLNHFRSSNSVSLPINKNGSSRGRIELRDTAHIIKFRDGVCCCRAHFEFSDDVPFTVAIGACMLSSLLLPLVDADSPPASVPDSDFDSRPSSALDSTDTRFAVMGIISFIPYFNWLSWVFAWLDTGKRRYVAYALVYLIPYLRSNLSLSPEESWLPIASIIFCIVHIQLEASVRNGDIRGFKLSSPGKRSHLDGDQRRTKGRSGKGIKLPQSREFGNWTDPKSTSDRHSGEGTEDGNETTKY